VEDRIEESSTLNIAQKEKRMKKIIAIVEITKKLKENSNIHLIGATEQERDHG
jgi:hypothetical protein